MYLDPKIKLSYYSVCQLLLKKKLYENFADVYNSSFNIYNV